VFTNGEQAFFGPDGFMCIYDSDCAVPE
jgi:hypothetical protein